MTRFRSLPLTLILLALGVLALAALVSMRVSVLQLRHQREERLLADAEVLGAALRDLDPYLVDPEESAQALLILRRFAAALSLRDVSVVELGDRILLSTSPELGPGSREPAVLTFSEQAEAAWQGSPTLTPVFQEAEQIFQTAFLPLRDERGIPATLLVVTVDRSDFQHLDLLRDSFRALVIGAGLVVILLLLLSLTIQRRAERAEADLEHTRRLGLAGKVAASVVHEVRNPLGIIRSTLEFLRDRGRDRSSDQETELFEEALEEADRIGEVLDRFLSLAREGPSEPKEVELGALCRAVALLVSKDLARRGIELTLELGDESAPCWVYCDERGLRQALLNLLLNARAALEGAATPSPGIVLRWSGPEGEGPVTVEVEDNGPGYPPEVLGEPFRAFRTSRPDGTGLGLPLVQRFARGAGGEAELENRSKSGAVARLLLPKWEGKVAGD